LFIKYYVFYKISAFQSILNQESKDVMVYDVEYTLLVFCIYLVETKYPPEERQLIQGHLIVINNDNLVDFLFFYFWCFNATFSNISAISWQPVLVVEEAELRSTWREALTMGKQLVSIITCGCESSATFFVIYTARCEPTPYW
jgi:hypothetical protein